MDDVEVGPVEHVHREVSAVFHEIHTSPLTQVYINAVLDLLEEQLKILCNHALCTELIPGLS